MGVVGETGTGKLHAVRAVRAEEKKVLVPIAHPSAFARLDHTPRESSADARHARIQPCLQARMTSIAGLAVGVGGVAFIAYFLWTVLGGQEERVGRARLP